MICNLNFQKRQEFGNKRFLIIANITHSSNLKVRFQIYITSFSHIPAAPKMVLVVLASFVPTLLSCLFDIASPITHPLYFTQWRNFQPCFAASDKKTMKFVLFDVSFFCQPNYSKRQDEERFNKQKKNAKNQTREYCDEV